MPRLCINYEAQLRSHEDLLRRLYVTENRSLKAVMDYMEAKFLLKVGASTYSRIFRDLNIRKNAKGHHWAYVDDRIRKRQRQGKPSVVYAQGKLVEHGKVKKEIARHVTTLQQITSAAGPGPATPNGWSVKSPGMHDDTTVESLEDDTSRAPDDKAATMPHVEAAEAIAGNTTAPSATNEPGYLRTDRAGLLAELRQSPAGFDSFFQLPFTNKERIDSDESFLKKYCSTCKVFDFLRLSPSPRQHACCRCESQSPAGFDSLFELPFTNKKRFDLDKIFLKENLSACKAFDFFSPPRSPGLQAWRWREAFGKDHHLLNYHYLSIAMDVQAGLIGSTVGPWDIQSGTRGPDLSPSYINTPDYREGIRILVLAMKNDGNSLRDIIDAKKRALQGEKLNNALETALYLTATFGLVDAARTLLAFGADPKATDIYNKPYRRVALESGQFEMVALLDSQIGMDPFDDEVDSGSGMERATEGAMYPDLEEELETDIDKSGHAVNGAQEDSTGSGPFGFHKWFDSVVVPWAQRNLESLGSSFSMGSFRAKNPSAPSSK